MSLLEAAFASETESDDEDFEDKAKPNSSDSDEDADDAAATHSNSSNSNSSSSKDSSGTAASVGASADADNELLVRGGRRKWRLEAKRSKRKEKQQQRQQQRAAADAVYAELKQQHEDALKKYPASVAADDVLLRFHKRQVTLRQPATTASVLGALRLECSKLQPSSAAAAAAAAAAVAAAARGVPGAALEGCVAAAAPVATAAPVAAALAVAADVQDAAASAAVAAVAGHDALAAAAAAAAASYEPPEKLDIAALKKRCRLTANEELRDIIKRAVQEGAATSEKVVSKTVRFAGRKFQIEERLTADEFAARQKTQQKKVKVRGDLEALEALEKALGNATTINSVQKSRADWSQFKEKAGIEEELKRGKGYLERQAFLASTTWNIHQQNVELRRQQQQAKQMQQQLQQQRPAGP